MEDFRKILAEVVSAAAVACSWLNYLPPILAVTSTSLAIIWYSMQIFDRQKKIQDDEK